MKQQACSHDRQAGLYAGPLDGERVTLREDVPPLAILPAPQGFYQWSALKGEGEYRWSELTKEAV